MKNVLLQAATKLNRTRKQKKWWQRTVRVLGTAVVFCTTYALILPAITMEQEPTCGMEAHEHTESCYVQQAVSTFVCGIGDDVKVVHTHEGICYDEQGALICSLPEIQEHTHDDSCYALSQTPTCDYVHTHSAECASVKPVLACGLEETQGHTHSDACTKQKALICENTESEGHTHSDSCGSVETALVCTEEEGESHTHGEGCYETRQIPCVIPESAGYTHSEGCYEIRDALCPLEEQEAHTHSETCYEEREVFCDETTIDGHVHEESCFPLEKTCNAAEIKLHSHEEACFDEEGSLICELPQVVAHIHTEECLVQAEEMVDVLTCQIPTHIHEDTCYPVEEQTEAVEYICGIGVHAHVETCFDEAGELICSIPEHDHEAACLVEGVDLTADVEDADDWKASVADAQRTGNWPKDVLAVAKTQLGYKESETNLVLTENVLKGYTRYGAWYGEPYGDWNAMFVSFCLNYAGVEDFPREADVNSWIPALEEKQLFKTPDTYSPKPGDLIFIDFDQKEDAAEPIPVEADQMGIVAERIPAAEGAPAGIKFIAGDVDGTVSYVTCDMDDVTVVGYADMPAGSVIFMNYEGEDFTVTVTFGPEAGIPDDAQLVVREILAGTEEYEAYYQQAVDALVAGMAVEVEPPQISFARFFDISFILDGMILEPAAAVDVQIRYSESVAVKEEEDGLVVHFADDGVEVLDADTYSTGAPEEETSLVEEVTEFFTGEITQVDTFEFVQNSFSVSGTIVTDAVGATTSYNQVSPNGLDGTGKVQYVVYAEYNGKYYAFDGNGNAVEITVNDDGTITCDNTTNLLWTFTSVDGAYRIYNDAAKRYMHAFSNNGTGVTTTGDWTSSVNIGTADGKVYFNVQSNADFAYLRTSNSNVVFDVTRNSADAAKFYLAAVHDRNDVFQVWFDGTNGGLMNLEGSPNTRQEVRANNNVITLPTTWTSPRKYQYALNGWYDIVNHTYYAPGATVTIKQNTVFYADWMAATYDVGQNNSHVVPSVDTNDFITTYVFDYNTLFNAQSLTHVGTITASGHTESWTILNSGKVPYNQENTLGFMFVDYDNNGNFSYAHGRDNTNANQSGITSGILAESNGVSGKNLLDLLFNPSTSVIGKKYVGTGNYLFQYMDSTTENYDGVHDGYYYLDARLNAASYNQSEKRFYMYNYLERTSDSDKDGGAGQYSDFLPFNSPYIFGEDDDFTGGDSRAGRVDYYTDTIRRPGWEYDAKGENQEPNYNTPNDAITNYFFGIRTDIEFFLPNNAGDQDEYGNYGNISTRGEHMIFDFHGDDDVWVFVDGQLMLDIGGLHGVMYGQIDFSSGTVTVGRDGGETSETKFNMSEGTHTMTVYYMERGSSQSNCAIYFNIAPRYDLQLRKEDVFTMKMLDGTEFSIFTDEACNVPAQLWVNEAAHNADMDDGKINDATNTFTVTNGYASCWGVSAGKTYYIKETKSPDGYPDNDDIIRVTLNNRGTATIETTTLLGGNDEATEGYAVIEQDINNTLKLVKLTITNQKDEDTTQIRVNKVWDENATDLPNSITAYLTVNGVRTGRPAVLTDANGWTYTWTGLPKYESDGVTPIEYRVEEIQVAGFEPGVMDYRTEQTAKIEWTKTDSMEDSTTYLLMNSGYALAYNGASFYWIPQGDAQNDETGMDAQWYVTTNQYGFRMTNGNGYALTYNPTTNAFYATKDTDIRLNQVIYYLEGRLVAHDHDLYFQFNLNGTAVSSDGLVFNLIRKDTVLGTVVKITNNLMDNEDHTFVEVNKVWEDDLDHSKDSVTLYLYANGVDTGREMVLSDANDWKGNFEGLPYADADGNKIIYTIVEDEPEDYDARYESEVVAGKQIVTWVKADTLQSGATMRIFNGANALSVNTEGEPVVVVNDQADTAQYWTVEVRNNNTHLKHVQSGRYLRVDRETITTVTNRNEASAVTLSNEVLMVGNRYLQMTRTTVSVSQYSYNATLFTVARRTEATGQPGLAITVINYDEEEYELPITGGMGTSPFTFGGLLIIAAALMYMSNFGRKLRKGGKYSR